MFESIDIARARRLQKELSVSTVKIAVADILQNATFEWPESPRCLVEFKRSLKIDNVVLTLDLRQIALSFAAHAHQFEADHDVEDLDAHGNLLQLFSHG